MPRNRARLKGPWPGRLSSQDAHPEREFFSFMLVSLALGGFEESVLVSARHKRLVSQDVCTLSPHLTKLQMSQKLGWGGVPPLCAP